LFHDVVASCDAVIAKPGYGTVGECMANGIPVMYYPRPEFAEYAALRRAMIEWGGAVQIPFADFTELRWRSALDRAVMLDPPRVDSSGAREAAREIMRLVSRGRVQRR
jgi:UDP-N-acetylglucosamine:LPS N-acetylglucosamine transferase